MQKRTVRILGLPIFSSTTESRSSNVTDLKTAKFLDWAGLKSAAGVTVNETNALTLSGYYGGVKRIAESIAILSGGVFEKIENKRNPLPNHPINRLIFQKANNIHTAYNYRLTIVYQIINKGDSYSLIIRDSLMRPIELRLQKYDDVTPFEFQNKIWYKVKGIEAPVRAEDMLHFKGLSADGVKGMSVLSFARESLGIGLAGETYAGRVFKAGGSKRTALVTPGELSDEAEIRLRNEWDAKYANPENAHRVAILQAGLDVKDIGVSPADAELLDSRKFTIDDIARFLSLPRHMLANTDSSSYKNEEQQGKEYINYTIGAWIKNIEEEVNDKLVFDNERGRVYIKFNVNSFARGDMAARSNYYTKMLTNGVMSPNEVRALEEMNPRDGGDDYFTQSNMNTQDQLALTVETLQEELNNLKNNSNG